MTVKQRLFMRSNLVTCLVSFAACTPKSGHQVGGRPSLVQPAQGVSIASSCRCETPIQKAVLIADIDHDRRDYVCGPIEISACCIKKATQDWPTFAADAWYHGKRGLVDTDLEFGDEVPKRSAWVLGGQLVVFHRPYATDAYCARYEQGILTVQVLSRARYHISTTEEDR